MLVIFRIVIPTQKAVLVTDNLGWRDRTIGKLVAFWPLEIWRS